MRPGDPENAVLARQGAFASRAVARPAPARGGQGAAAPVEAPPGTPAARRGAQPPERSAGRPAGAPGGAYSRRAPGSSLSKNKRVADPLRLPTAGVGETWSDPVDGRLRQKSVQACERGLWAMLSWPTEAGREGHEYEVRPFRCGSWRCRRCGWWTARDDYRRVEAGALSRSWWLYLVLTFDPKDWRSPWDAYTGAYELWHDGLRKRLQRAYGRVEYVQTWERHVRTSRYPHVNVLLTGDGLREEVIAQGIEDRFDDRAGHGRGRWCRFPRWRTSWLAQAAPAVGFGRRVWAEVIDAPAAMAWYLVKAAHDLADARFKVGDQTPIGAPPGFRRFRASHGLLPPRAKGDGTRTGAIVTEPVSAYLDQATGELEVGPEDADVARRAALAAAAWRASRPKPEPQYERAPTHNP